jgi:hypothetical protein
MKRLGLKPQGTLQRFQQSKILGDIVILEDLCMLLWKNGKNLISHSLSNKD